MDNPTTITVTWDDLRRSLTIDAKAVGASSCLIQAGYGPNTYLFSGKNTLTVTDIPHTTEKFLYIRAVGLNSDGTELVAGELLTAVSIKHPILGIVRTCDGDKNIIDFVEKKNGVVTPRFKDGKRVVRISTFDVNFYDGDELYTSQVVCAKQPMKKPEDPTGEGDCQFAFWKYETPDPEIDDRAIVTFSPGSENIKDYPFQKVKVGEKLVEPPDPVNPNGCPFDGWYYIV